MDNVFIIIVLALLVLAFALGYLRRAKLSAAILHKARLEADGFISAELKDVSLYKEENYERIAAEIARRRLDFEADDNEQRSIIQVNEKRLQKKQEVLSVKQEQVAAREADISRTESSLSVVRTTIDSLFVESRSILEKLAGMTASEAKAVLLDNTAMETKQDCAARIKRVESDMREYSNKASAEVITTAIQRCSAGHVDEPDTPSVPLLNDEVKLRLLGRDGKNLKQLQNLTGVEWGIDPERGVLVFTSHDCVKREIARMMAQRLVAETRIHSHKIQDTYDKVRKEINSLILDEGQRAIVAADIKGLHPDLVKLLGRLQFRTSYGQNVLVHSVEVSRLAGAMAAELGANTTLARRAGLLHDIGKALDHELEGSHVLIGVDIARKHNESREVIHCIAAHHGDEEFESIEASLVSSADTLSAGRPGARRETLESYIKRVEALELMASSFEGVDKAYAIHAGREVRVLVKPEKVSDESAALLSSLVARKLEDELEYPGQIRVVVVRETRAIDYAK